MGEVVVDCRGSTDAVDSSLTYNFTLYYDNDGVWDIKKTFTKSNTTDGVYTMSDSEWFDIAPLDYIINCRVTDDVNNQAWGANQSITVEGSEDKVSEQKKSQIITQREPKKISKGLIVFIVLIVIIVVVLAVLAIYLEKPVKGKKR